MSNDGINLVRWPSCNVINLDSDVMPTVSSIMNKSLAISSEYEAGLSCQQEKTGWHCQQEDGQVFVVAILTTLNQNRLDMELAFCVYSTHYRFVCLQERTMSSVYKLIGDVNC